MSIPKIIHQTWKTKQIPSVYDLRWIDSWKKYNPDWEYKLWTDEDLRNLVKDKYSWFLPIYDTYPHNIFRVDAARYFILHHHGGLYVDLDFECLKSFDPLLDNNVVFGYRPDNQDVVRYYNIPNALMMSVQYHPFWEIVFEKMVQSWKNILQRRGGVNSIFIRDVHFLTGSCLLYFSVCYDKMSAGKNEGRASVTIYPYYYFYPVLYSKYKDRYKQDVIRYLSTDESKQSYAVTYWSYGWDPKYQW